jgi:glycosyltransferase involved in cell wall biosynthesis
VGGLADMVDEGAEMILCAPGDADALAGAVERLHDDRALSQRLAKHGRETVMAHYDIGRVVRQHERLYGEIIASHA